MAGLAAVLAFVNEKCLKVQSIETEKQLSFQLQFNLSGEKNQLKPMKPNWSEPV